jgi:hypothetical protein
MDWKNGVVMVLIALREALEKRTERKILGAEVRERRKQAAAFEWWHLKTCGACHEFEPMLFRRTGQPELRTQHDGPLPTIVHCPAGAQESSIGVIWGLVNSFFQPSTYD